MSPMQRVAAILVGALAVIILAVLVLNFTETPVAGGPDASATVGAPGSVAATRSASPPAGNASSDPSPSPSLPGAAAIQEQLAEIEEQVIAIRGLPAADIGPADIITREQLGAELQAIFDAEYPPDERERDNRALRALGLLGPDDDVAELQLQLLGDSVLGFYDDVEQRMVVVSDEGLDAEAKLTYAHEYTHALQDAAFGLDSLETDAPGADDRSLARTALIEGDATATMLAWAFEHLSPEELLELGSTPIPDTTGIPSWMIDQLQFPYTAGQVWVTAIGGGDPLAPDFSAIDAAYADPPDSTEQIIDIDAWETREMPVDVEVVDLAAALGDGWEQVDATPIGEAAIEITLDHFGVSGARDAAAGWGGDRAVIVSGPDDGFAVAWELAWDTEADAAEFVDAYGAVIAELPFPADVQPLSDTELLVIHASERGLLERVSDAAR